LYFVKTPKLFTKIFPDVIWECPSDRPELQLTFDDGPSTNTENILDYLAEHGLTASFFCLGQQIEKHPDVFNRMIEEGHLVGNHGYAHLDGWKNSTNNYIDDVERGYQLCKSRLFRPPFGRLTYSQYQSIKNKFQIVMWSMMPGDFDQNVSIQKCQSRLSRVNKRDIIVLHDHDDSTVLELLKLIVLRNTSM